jgi:hypothetical protein
MRSRHSLRQVAKSPPETTALCPALGAACYFRFMSLPRVQRLSTAFVERPGFFDIVRHEIKTIKKSRVFFALAMLDRMSAFITSTLSIVTLEQVFSQTDDRSY